MMKVITAKVVKEEKRHLHQMSEKEVTYIEKTLQNFLGKYFYNGGKYRICPHAKERIFRKGRGEVTKRSLKMVLLFGNLIEFKKITFSDKQTELRCVFRLDEQIVVYDFFRHTIVTFWKNSKDDHHETLDVSKYTLSRKQVSKFLDELVSA